MPKRTKHNAEFRGEPALPAGEPGFGIYVHWPFCLSKCPYCDFNSHVAAGIEVAAWRRAYETALDWFAERTRGWRVTSVFFGGGTPSLMPPALVEAVLAHIAALWPVAEDAEITLEANPTSAEAQKFADFASAGVNRLSLGIQALNDADLKALGRAHTAAQARDAWHLAQRIFPRASFDLIYARPGQTPARWRAELRQALALDPAHVAAYQLTMEPHTPFWELHRRGRLRLPDEDTALALYELTQEVLSSAGLQAYEVSNHARAGEECRHNMLYWRYGPYAGVGPGAHGRLVDASGRRCASEAIRHPARWLKTVLEQKDAGLVRLEELSAREVALEYLLMSLRTREGTDLRRLAAISNHAPDEKVLNTLIRQGLLARAGDEYITATPAGRLLLDSVLGELAGALHPLNGGGEG